MSVWSVSGLAVSVWSVFRLDSIRYGSLVWSVFGLAVLRSMSDSVPEAGSVVVNFLSLAQSADGTLIVGRQSSSSVVGRRLSSVIGRSSTWSVDGRHGHRQSSVGVIGRQSSVVIVIGRHRRSSSSVVVVGRRCRSSIVGHRRSSIIGRQSSVVVGRRSPLLVKQTRHPALLLAECWSWVRRDSLLTATVCIWKGVGSAGFIANGVASDGEGSHGLGLDRVIPMESVWKASALTAVVQMALVLTVLAQLEMEWAHRDSLLLATVCIWKGVGSAGFIANGVASDGEGSHGLGLDRVIPMESVWRASSLTALVQMAENR